MGFKLKKVFKGAEKVFKTWGDLMVGAGVSPKLGRKIRKGIQKSITPKSNIGTGYSSALGWSNVGNTGFRRFV